MDSHDRPPGPREDAEDDDVEVVFCHACSEEWDRGVGGLTCPFCGSDITEIVDPENDPRDHMHHDSASTSPEVHPYDYHADSDPDEADIEEHLGPHGFQYRRSTRAGPGHTHHDPGNDVVLGEFMRMLRGFGPPQRPGGDGFYSPPTGGGFGERHVHHTTIRTGPFGMRTASVTVFTGPARTSPRGNAHPGETGGDPFQAIFSNVIRDMGPPEGEHPGGPPPGFAEGLQEIMSMLWPGAARSGDAVYSQEALDRIITSLMEANPQNNAAPPATEDALKNLDRRPVTKELLGPDGKTECSICIDTLEEGQTAAFLPCKHWFHDECVVAWLKEHNTCPICRTPIETNTRNSGNNRRNEASSSANNEGNRWPGPGTGGSAGSFNLRGVPGGFNAFVPPSGPPGNGPRSPMENSRPVRNSRPPSQSQSRLNEALRNISSMQREQVRERDRDHNNDISGVGYGTGYDTSRLQRRDSSSPTSPRAVPYTEHGARMRQRSPPQSGRRNGSDREPRRQSGQGPISWLRDRFTGGSGSGSGSRDDRRS